MTSSGNQARARERLFDAPSDLARRMRELAPAQLAGAKYSLPLSYLYKTARLALSDDRVEVQRT